MLWVEEVMEFLVDGSVGRDQPRIMITYNLGDNTHLASTALAYSFWLEIMVIASKEELNSS